MTFKLLILYLIYNELTLQNITTTVLNDNKLNNVVLWIKEMSEFNGKMKIIGISFGSYTKQLSNTANIKLPSFVLNLARALDKTLYLICPNYLMLTAVN